MWSRQPEPDLRVTWPARERCQADNGGELIPKVIDKWAYESGIKIGFSRPTTPASRASSRRLSRMPEHALACRWTTRGPRSDLALSCLCLSGRRVRQIQ